MIHHSCDRCKRILNPNEEMRYAIRMDVRAVIDVTDECVDEERDHLLEVHELLEIAEDLDCDDSTEDIYRQMRFDLCPDCFRQFVKSPVGKDVAAEFNFSEN